MSGHTPGPWKAVGPSSAPLQDEGDYAIVDADGLIIAETFLQVAQATNRPAHANAAFIVKAVNNHDDLVGSLRDIARRAEDETLGIQVARLTAIANQAHAAIRDSEATT